MRPNLSTWIETTARRRGEHLAGAPFAPGLVAAHAADPAACRRAAAAVLVTLVGDRPASVHFRRGESYANLDDLVVNIDGALVEPKGAVASVDFLDLLFGVAVHEGAHLYESQTLRRTTAVRRWIHNVVEDERIEVATARRLPALGPVLATTRRELIRPAEARGFLGALFLLVRAPTKLGLMALLHRRRLESAIRILTPFPETHADVLRAVRRLARLVPRDEARRPPSFPCLELRGRARVGRRGGDLRRGRGGGGAREMDAWSGDACEVRWQEAEADAAGYACAAAAAHGDALLLRAALTAAVTPRLRPMATRGRLDRRRLHAWRWDDRIYRTITAAPRDVTILLILDLSGSMRSWWDELRHVAVAFSEAVCGLAHVRLFVYGHAADGDGEPRTEITRFATPARGPVLGLGSLPPGANNRDGHALDLIARDVTARVGRRADARIAIHLCDNAPAAQDYGGLPARRATADAMQRFGCTFGPLLTLLFGAGKDTGSPDRRVVRWRDEGGMRDLATALARHL
jgi:hypothetical protein